ncbi:MAG: response regulator [Alphaproteobacteria bacterium]|nr:MAG: response regulator [Alphaproteobacteria bacterium]
MRVLIVESDAGLAGIWRAHLERQGAEVNVASTQEAAICLLREHVIDVIVLNLLLAEGSAFAVADFASYRQPAARVVFVTNSSFFSDGSIFRHIPNACAFLPTATPPEDLAAVVDHYGMQ